jgi:hypothetical protein
MVRTALVNISAAHARTQGVARSDAAQIPLRSDVEGPPELRPIDKIKTWDVNYAELAAKLQAIQPFLKRWVESGS